MLSFTTSSLLLPPQIPHVETLLESLMLNGHASDLSEMGTGKTYSACAVIKECQLPVFIVCPKAVIKSWEKVLALFNITPIAIINYEKLSRGNTKYYKYIKKNIKIPIYNKDTFYEINKEVGEYQNIPSNAIIVFDEVHRCGGLETSVSELLFAATNQGYKRFKLSGSVATDPLKMFAVGYSNTLHPYTTVSQFKRNFCIAYGATFGKGDQMDFDVNTQAGHNGMLNLHNEMFNIKKCASRLTKKDMGTYFPETKISPLALDMGANSNKIQAVYSQMQYELDMLEERSQNYSQHIFAILMKTRRHTELLKIPAFVQEIEDGVAEGNSVACFFNFTDTLQGVVERLNKNKDIKGKISYVIGGQTNDERQQNIEDFQSDKNIVILCNIKAGGTGISLHDLNGVRSRLALVSPGWSAIELIQALSRVDRQGGKTKSYQKVIFAQGVSVEEIACNRLQYRIDNLSALNDGDLLSGVRFYGKKDSIDFEELNENLEVINN